MSKERKSKEDKVDISWIDWFQTLKLNKPKGLAIFFTVLSNFVEAYPRDANYLTVEDLHTILLDEI